MLVMQQGSQHRVVSVTDSEGVCAGLFRQFRFLPCHVMIIYKGSHVRASGRFSQCVCQRVCQYSQAVSCPGSCIYNTKLGSIRSSSVSVCQHGLAHVHGFSLQWVSTGACNTVAFQCKRRVANIMLNPALTPLLPRYHLTNKRAKFETPKPFCLLFCNDMWKDFIIKTHSFESRCVIGPENILFAGASVPLSARQFYRPGLWRG